MSAGTSSSSGTEQSQQNSKGTRAGTSNQAQQSNTTFDTTGTSSVAVPRWAKTGNEALFNERAGGEHEAVDFLTGLLSNPLDSSGNDHNRYATALNNLFSTQLTRARSGDSQSVGVGKQAMRESDALVGAQTSAIQTGAGAANSLLTNANPYAALDFSRLISPTTQHTTGMSGTTGNTTTQSKEATTGQQTGNTQQQGSNGGFGITICCFIFMEAYHGKMPWYVRRCRDEFCSGERVSGYVRMARWLVPWMRRSKLVGSIVWRMMISPLTGFGGWLYGQNRWGWLLAPIVAFWFGFWAITAEKEV